MALAFSRKPKVKCDSGEKGHSFTLDFGGASAVVTVYEVIGSEKVRVSIEAPAEIKITRDDCRSTVDRNRHGGEA